MNKLVTLLLCLLPLCVQADILVGGLRVENMADPLGLDTPQPRFSWRIETGGKKPETHVLQTHYRILVCSSYEKFQKNEGDLWDSGEVESSEQLWIPYGGRPLKSNQHAYWKVRVRTNRGDSQWSFNPHRFSTGLLGETQWRGRWIGLERLMPGEQTGKHSRLAARYLRREFRLSGKQVSRATAFIAGLGLYRLYINGQCAQHGDVELTPLPSDYRKTVYYDTYDVTSLLQNAQADGRVAVGIVLGNGRYFAMRQDKPYKNATFGLPKCRMNIVVEYADGHSERLVTDETWRVTADGPIRANNEYDGEEYDARHELGRWTLPGYDDSRWLQAERSAIPTGTLRGRVSPNMAVQQVHRLLNGTDRHGRLVYKKLTPLKGKPHTYILDFGRNMAGRVSFMPRGQRGDTIRLRYAERLNADGTLYTDNLRDARSEDIYVCSGQEPLTDEWDGQQAWHATFVTHGFRYVELSGIGHPDARCFVAEEIYDDMGETGHFECSDTLLNRVIANAWQGIVSNYKGMPVDCPQRNERQPWLGDRTVGSLGESFLFDNERLYTKWMRDICEAQREDGCIPDVAPAYWNYYTDDVTWPAALPFGVDMLYRQYGNDEAMRRWYPGMKRWLSHILDTYCSADGLITKDKYADWCVPPERPELIHSQDPTRQTDGTLIATAYTVRCLQLMARFARHLGLSDDALYWSRRQETMKYDFNRRFLTHRPGTSPRPQHVLYPDSTFYGNNTVTANLLPLAFGIVPDSLRATIARQVVENIEVKNKGHLSCGVIGVSWLMRTLSDCGFADVAWHVATQSTYPSWGYMARQGATTIWELWNGDTANPAMNSANHVMLLGDLLPWCFQTLGGIRQEAPSDPLSGTAPRDDVAYRHFTLRPDFSIDGCDRVSCSMESPYGRIASEYSKTPEHLVWTVTIPCNTTATVCLPDGRRPTLGSGRHTFSLDLPKRSAILRDEFLYTEAPFASPHASTIVETRSGQLVCAYFAGTYERNPDCNIYVSIRDRHHWSAPILVSDGGGVACWNPVLFEMPDGELWLFFKIGRSVKEWTGWLCRSRDGGRTWSEREALPSGFLGPVKNKPLLVGRRLVCGSSTETDGWRFHVELYDLDSRQWQYVGPVESTLAMKTDDGRQHPIDCIQPSILQLADGRLQVLMRTHNARLATSFSSDGGLTWTPVTLTDIENNQSGTDAVTLADGRHALVYNNFATLPLTRKGPRTPLSLAISNDDGRSWHHVLTLEDSPAGEYSYPAIVQGRDGTLHITYTWQRRRIAYKQIKMK